MKRNRSGNGRLAGRRLRELTAILMIGDGMLALLGPQRHVRLWQEGPRPWRSAMDAFLRRPALTRSLGAAGVGLGVWLASRQQPPTTGSWLPRALRVRR